MKTGYNLVEPTGLSTSEKIDICALVTTFGENALVTSCKYVEHSGRNGVTVKDISMGMKLEVFIFLKRDNSKSIQKYKKEIAEDYYRMEDKEDEDDDFYIDDDKLDAFSKSTCKCVLCKRLNAIDEEWNTWIPKTDFEELLKKNIDKI